MVSSPPRRLVAQETCPGRPVDVPIGPAGPDQVPVTRHLEQPKPPHGGGREEDEVFSFLPGGFQLRHCHARSTLRRGGNVGIPELKFLSGPRFESVARDSTILLRYRVALYTQLWDR